MATNRDSLFDSILENSMNTGLKSNLDSAILNAGVKDSEKYRIVGVPYDIIRKNLVSKTITGINILGKDIINIDISSDGDIVTYNLSTIFDTYGVDRPNYAEPTNKWGGVKKYLLRTFLMICLAIYCQRCVVCMQVI